MKAAALSIAWPAPAARPLAPALLLAASAAAWAWLVHLQWFAGFDPGSLQNVCLGFGRASAASLEALWRMGAALWVDGALMVAAMMLPVALCAGLPIAGYVSAWLAAVTGTVALTLGLAASGWLGADAAWVRALSAVLAVLGAALQLRAAWVRRHAAARERRPDSPAGWHGGWACVAHCAVPMLALHAVYGMSVPAMATYTVLAAWRTGSTSGVPPLLAAVGLGITAWVALVAT
jgi:hypothetical protein